MVMASRKTKTELISFWEKKFEKVERFSMDPKLKREWLVALRSGRYPQGVGTLKREGNYCCLGVLCDVFRLSEHQGRWQEEWDENGPHSHNDKDEAFVVGDLGASLFPPKAVTDQAFPQIPESAPDVWEWLSEINDTGKFTFAEIADIIEREF